MVSFTSLYSGSRKNASLISSDHANILIDCGGSLKSLNDHLNRLGKDISGITHIFITHSHSDHIAALKAIIKKYNIKIYASLGTHEEIYDMGINMHKENRVVLYPDTWYDLGRFSVCAFITPHDTSEPFGYNFEIDEKKITVATDIGFIFEGFENKITAEDLLFFESNHDVEMLKRCNRPMHIINRILGKKGHLCNCASAEFTAKLAKRGLKRLMLGHLSNDANTSDLALETTRNYFLNNSITETEIYLASRDGLSETIFL